MKKFPLFCTLYFVFCTSSVFAYTQTDISNAQFLADKWIIVKQSTTAGYRLDSTITRAELVGIALKLKWVTLPSYQCRWYFTDVRNNDWICRAVELAADNSLVTRANARFRAQDNITRAEALAILISHLDASFENYHFFTNEWNQWQKNTLYKFINYNGQFLTPWVPFSSLLTWTGITSKVQWSAWEYFWSPNRAATRAEVFGFARNILENNWTSNNTVYANIFSADFWGDFSRTDHEVGVTFRFGEKVQALESLLGDLTHRYALTIYDKEKFFYAVGDEFEKKWTYKWKTYYIFNYWGMCGGRILVFFSGNKAMRVGGICESEIDGALTELNKIDFDITSGYRLLTSKDILNIYYQRIDTHSTDIAYSMRSPAWVSFETFESWYKNVTNVTFREDTLKNLWDNTYQFLVDMTENWIKSTYKVTSKVDLENFTINNISSVKQ